MEESLAMVPRADAGLLCAYGGRVAVVYDPSYRLFSGLSKVNWSA